jgi:hypothetical protein
MRNQLKYGLVEEAGRALIHYSNCIMNMRTVTIVQGLLLLTGAGFTLKQSTSIYLYLLCLLGFVFTSVLWLQHRNYLKDYDAVLRYVKKIDPWKSGPWGMYMLMHEKRKKKLFYKLCVKHGPFYFFMLVFITISILKRWGILPVFTSDLH